MKENEFDIYVRNLMAGAEESVSPDVWKGVEAGLDRAARKRTVPVWLWRGVAAAAVAAAAAAFVLLRPAQNLSNQPTNQPYNNPSPRRQTPLFRLLPSRKRTTSPLSRSRLSGCRAA